MMRIFFSIFSVFFFSVAVGQIGGSGVFESLKLAPSARTAALGGYQIAAVDNELSLGFQNPALLNEKMDRQLLLTQVNYLSDINFGFAGYTRSIDSANTLLLGIQYITYGQFDRTDEYGNYMGSFSGGDYNFTAGLGHLINERWRVGANLKLIYSQLEKYNSMGLATDLGVTYHVEDKNFTSSLVVRNLGFQIYAYDEQRENLPLDVQLAFSKKLTNAPFRFNLMVHHLNKPDLTYINTNKPKVYDLETNTLIEEKIPFSEIIARHFILGTEILLSKNFHIRIGYNHQRRKEMILDKVKGVAGYSWGFGVRVWKFQLNYASANYHIGTATNFFSITSNLNSWMKEKPKPEESELE